MMIVEIGNSSAIIPSPVAAVKGGRVRVTVISTVLNEGEAIRRLLDSLLAQTRRPDELVIVDGGSRDSTVAVIQEYAGRLPLRVLVEPGANISRGRNVAIAAATGDVVASVDAGVWLETQWLEKLVEPLIADGKWQIADRKLQIADREAVVLPSDQPSAFGHQLSAIGHSPSAVAGFFVPDVHTTFEIAMGATVLPTVDEIKPETFLPSSRSVAFTKEAWAAVGGYPEWIDYCEDLIFDFRLRDAAGPFAWAPDAVAHFRPRGSLKAFFKQYYRYARGDGKADLWRKKHLIRYVTYLIALPGLLALSLLHSPGWWFVLLAGVMFYCATPYRRLHPQLAALTPLEQVKAVILVPVIRALGDVAKMLGYPAGWVWRLQNWSRAEVHWQRNDTEIGQSL
jgi:glycosyltransferase involved in cell wall biosynthesis